MSALPTATFRKAHRVAPNVMEPLDVSGAGHRLVLATAAIPYRERVIAQTFAREVELRGLVAKESRRTTLASIDPDGTLAWCRLVPPRWSLSHDGEELVWPVGSRLVHVRIDDPTPRVRKAGFAIHDVCFADDADWLLVSEDHSHRIHRCGRFGDVAPRDTFEMDGKLLLAANEKVAVVHDSFRYDVWDFRWRCVRQRLRTELSFEHQVRRWGDSLVLFEPGGSRVEVHDPWWGGMREHELGEAVQRVDAGRVLVGEDEQTLVRLDDGWPEPAPDEPPLPVALATCNVFVLESGEPCFFTDRRVLGPKTISEGNVVTAVAQAGTSLFVAAQNILSAHSLERRDHRKTFNPAHDVRESITALAVCGDHLVSAGTDRRVAVWTFDGVLVHERRQDAAIWDIATGPQGELVTVGDEGIVRIFPDATKDEHHALHIGLAHAVAATPNLIALALRERIVFISWKGEPKWEAWAHVGSIAAHPERDLFAIGTSEGDVMLTRPSEHRTISRGHAPNPSLAFDRRGTRLFIGSGTPDHPCSAMELEIS